MASSPLRPVDRPAPLERQTRRSISLSEVMIAVAILGVLAAMAVPTLVRRSRLESTGGAALDLGRLITRPPADVSPDAAVEPPSGVPAQP